MRKPSPFLLSLLLWGALIGAACQDPAQPALAQTVTDAAPAAAAAPTATAIPPTPTPRPTATSAPTAKPAATAIPPTPAPVPSPLPSATPPSTLRFTVQKTVNVRRGPGTNYDIVGQLKAGQTGEVTGRNAARDWLQFTFGQGSGWLSAGLVSLSGSVNSVALAANIPPAPAAGPDRIVAPAIKLDARIIPIGWRQVKTASGTTMEWEVAAYAAGWHKNTAHAGATGNTVISGHHNIDGEVFRYVVDLKPGDPITIYEGGKTYRYIVADKMILPDKYVSQAQRIDNGKWIGPFPDERLTLVTCWPYTNNTHRVIVIARPG